MMQQNMSPIAISAHVAKGHYTGPHTQQGSLVANNPPGPVVYRFFES